LLVLFRPSTAQSLPLTCIHQRIDQERLFGVQRVHTEHSALQWFHLIRVANEISGKVQHKEQEVVAQMRLEVYTPVYIKIPILWNIRTFTFVYNFRRCLLSPPSV